MSDHISRWLSALLGPALADESIDTTDYIEHLERAFTIHIGPGDLHSVETVMDMCNYISAQLAAGGRSMTADQVWPTVKEITAEEFGVDQSEITPWVRFVDDLNC